MISDMRNKAILILAFCICSISKANAGNSARHDECVKLSTKTGMFANLKLVSDFALERIPGELQKKQEFTNLKNEDLTQILKESEPAIKKLQSNLFESVTRFCEDRFSDEEIASMLQFYTKNPAGQKLVSRDATQFIGSEVAKHYIELLQMMSQKSQEFIKRKDSAPSSKSSKASGKSK